jgi:hypothetical protein
LRFGKTVYDHSMGGPYLCDWNDNIRILRGTIRLLLAENHVEFDLCQ